MFFPMLIASYLLGSIPFGLLLGFAAGKDIRHEGSKNIGATNTLRVCGWKLGIAALVLDVFKGFAAVWWISRLSGSWPPAPFPALAAAVAAVLGHNFPIWLRFKGGKGVATSIGAVAGLMWAPFLVFGAVFLVTVAVSRYISLGSMLGSVALAVSAIFILPRPFDADLPLVVTAILLSALIFIRHRANIGRIFAGTENRFPPPKNRREEAKGSD